MGMTPRERERMGNKYPTPLSPSIRSHKHCGYLSPPLGGSQGNISPLSPGFYLRKSTSQPTFSSTHFNMIIPTLPHSSVSCGNSNKEININDRVPHFVENKKNNQNQFYYHHDQHDQNNKFSTNLMSTPVSAGAGTGIGTGTGTGTGIGIGIGTGTGTGTGTEDFFEDRYLGSIPYQHFSSLKLNRSLTAERQQPQSQSQSQSQTQTQLQQRQG